EIFGAGATPADDTPLDPGLAEPGAEPDEEAAEDEPASPLQEITQGDVAGSDVLRALDRSLDIGGRAYLALQYTFYEAGDPLFPPLTSPSLLALYVDARPYPRVRAYAEARLDFDFTAPDDDGVTASPLGFTQPRQELRLDQLWLKLDAAEVA